LEKETGFLTLDLAKTVVVENLRVPRFLYGTAWKEERTQPLTERALQQGFRGIDTANQRRHYHEAAVGAAITASVENGLIARSDLFLQTKFTFRPAQDDRLPYDPQASIPVQVQQSFASSLEHLGVEVIDSYLLHGPVLRVGLSPPDWAAWRAMEAIHDSGRTRLLGVCNISLEQLQRLCEGARIRPSFVQNRCRFAHAWDRPVRRFCKENGLIFQGFSLLTGGNEALRSNPELAGIARRHGRSVSQIIFRFALEAGMVALTGTTDAAHMKADIETLDFALEPNEVEQIESLLGSKV
jgi:diketogulonate reductase-like aldo/keto reductase